MPAPIGNKYAIGNSGKQKTFKTPEDLLVAVNNYFESCQIKEFVGFDNKNNAIYQDKRTPLSVEGLCAYLHIDRQTLLNYQSKEGYEEFFDIVKIAKQMIYADQVERGLLGQSDKTLTIFLFKNQGYSDKPEGEKEPEQGQVIQIVKMYDKDA